MHSIWHCLIRGIPQLPGSLCDSHWWIDVGGISCAYKFLNDNIDESFVLHTAPHKEMNAIEVKYMND